MSDFIQWEENLKSAIHSLSDLDLQKKTWSSENEFCSSFEEDIMTLYDDNCFKEEFWYESNLKNFKIKDFTLEKLQLFKDNLDIYLKWYYEQEKRPDYENILVDSRWIELTQMAKNIIENW